MTFFRQRFSNGFFVEIDFYLDLHNPSERVLTHDLNLVNSRFIFHSLPLWKFVGRAVLNEITKLRTHHCHQFSNK
jgi:hypothetical protein